MEIDLRSAIRSQVVVEVGGKLMMVVCRSKIKGSTRRHKIGTEMIWMYSMASPASSDLSW
jgi:hypothetical protein